MNIEEIKLELQKNLKPKRYEHSINVMKESVKLAKIYGADGEKAALAGLLHDCAKNVKGEEVFKLCREYDINIDEIAHKQPELLHGPLGAEIARRKYGIEDREILSAINYHTTGCAGMKLLEKIVFLADYTEPGRGFKGVEEIREAAYKNIDRAILISMNSTIRFVLQKNALLHIETINARNFILQSGKTD